MASPARIVTGRAPSTAETASEAPPSRVPGVARLTKQYRARRD